MIKGEYENKDALLHPIILHTTGLLHPTILKENAKKITQLEEEVYKLTNDLPDQITLRPSLYFSRKEKITSLHFVKSPLLLNKKQMLANERHIQIFFSRATHKQRLFGKENRVDTRFVIKLNIFSDNELEALFHKFLASRQEEHMYVDTEYSFDANGNAAKAIWLPSEVPVQRKPVEDLNIVKVYQSQITREDVDTVEQALLLLKIQLEAYISIKHNSLKN